MEDCVIDVCTGAAYLLILRLLSSASRASCYYKSPAITINKKQLTEVHDEGRFVDIHMGCLVGFIRHVLSKRAIFGTRWV
jgi:hypothetical protein